MTTLSASELAGCIQFTLIRRGVTRREIEHLCHSCLEYRFNAAMVPGCWVALAHELLAGSKVEVASAVDFPFGVMSTTGKVAEACALIEAGADQLDIGVHIGMLKSGMDAEFSADIAAVVEAIAPRPVKVMLELPLLTEEERERAVRLAQDAGARYLKNASSGVVGAATPEEIRFLRERARPGVGVKASGGIRTRRQADALIAAGADLLGTSAAVEIVTGRDDIDSADY